MSLFILSIDYVVIHLGIQAFSLPSLLIAELHVLGFLDCRSDKHKLKVRIEYTLAFVRERSGSVG